MGFFDKIFNKEENNKEDNDTISLLNSLKSKDVVPKDIVIDNQEDKEDKTKELFDIKKLNDIDDKMIRGIAKKVYMSGKRADKKSEDVIDDIKLAINDSGKMTKEIEALLGEII